MTEIISSTSGSKSRSMMPSIPACSYVVQSCSACLESTKKNGNCSLSDGMRKLGQAKGLRAFDIGDATWQDVDTPEALAYTEILFDQHFCPVPLTERSANV